MRPESSLPPAYFEDMFAADDDPWRFETSPYEKAKHLRTVEALGSRRYESALEVGCATGVLTRLLADRVETLLSIDVSETALARGRVRCADRPSVAFARMVFPEEAPQDTFDLVVLSEVVYYWKDRDIALAAERLAASLAPGGDMLLVHWTGETDYPQAGDGAVERLSAALPFPASALISERTDAYRLDLWRAG